MTDQDKKVQEAREHLMESCGGIDNRYVIVNADSYDQYVEDDCNGVDPFPDKQEVFVPQDRMLK